MTIIRRLTPAALGLALVLHGLALTVLPLRGADAAVPGAWLPLVTAFWVLAVVGFVAAGLGVLGVRPLRGAIIPCALTAGVAALAAQFWQADTDLWPGVVFSSTLPLLATLQAVVSRSGVRPAHPRWRLAADVIGVVINWLLTDPEAESYNGQNIEAQFFCHERGLLPGWAGPRANDAPIRYDLSGKVLLDLEADLRARLAAR